MPSLFPFANHGTEDAVQETVGNALPQDKPRRRASLLRSLGKGFLKKHNEHSQQPQDALHDRSIQESSQLEAVSQELSSIPDETLPRRAIPSLPRPQTFTRQESERRDKLLEIAPSHLERRATSIDRRRGISANADLRRSLSKQIPIPCTSAPEFSDRLFATPELDLGPADDSLGFRLTQDDAESPPTIPGESYSDESNIVAEDEQQTDEIDRRKLQQECDQRWILNLSMHFRDESNREKFFITFAEAPGKWRRLTVSLDYRDAPPGSLEETLSQLVYQRDKSFHIYEAIHESLPEIQYYSTVTNLKLQTTPEDGQLHVHVREDANEIVHYPPLAQFAHVESPRVKESELEFISHLSGFVYKVKVNDEIVIKKEIPGPDTVDEFLYEVNALHSLLDSEYVVQLKGLVTDDNDKVVRGLLIAYAPKGALVDIIYDTDPIDLPWHRRERWALQIVQGLSDIHEAGFVQGDFTLSNIVVDDADNIKIIDINRRGCPVGWEPPELRKFIKSGQRIGMCIGVKTDLFQLGMVLWGLAQNIDDPEREDRPLRAVSDAIPDYFRHMVETCLCDRPQGRPSATNLVRCFPFGAGLPPTPSRPAVEFAASSIRFSNHSLASHRSSKEYMDPALAVTLDDVLPRHAFDDTDIPPFASGQIQYIEPFSATQPSDPSATSYRFDSSGGSWVVGRRGRSPVSGRPRRQSSPFTRSRSSLGSSTTSISQPPPSRTRPRCGSECSAKADELEQGSVDDTEAFVRVSPQPISDAQFVQDDSLNDKLVDSPLRHSRRSPPSNDAAHGHRNNIASPLMHIDSGFDEQMIDEIEFGGGLDGEKDGEHLEPIDELGLR